MEYDNSKGWIGDNGIVKVRTGVFYFGKELMAKKRFLFLPPGGPIILLPEGKLITLILRSF